MKPKVNIIGVNSVIGSYLYSALQTTCTINGTYFNHKIETGNIYLDITNYENLLDVLSQFDGSIVILLSACKDVKKCEENYDLSYRLNTQPVKDIVEIIEKNRYNIKFIFFSSDYVFEGTTGNYAPESLLNPKTNYGRTKAAAENLLMHSKIDNIIIRTSSVMGPRALFFTWLIKAIKNGEDIELFSNIYFSPTPINFLSEIMIKVINDYYYTPLNVPSIMHIVGERRLSRFELAREIYFILKGNGRLIPVIKDLANDTFQKDLSMKQSEYVKNIQNKIFIEYIKAFL